VPAGISPLQASSKPVATRVVRSVIVPGPTEGLVVQDAAKAIEFYKKAFNAVEIKRMPGPQGKLMHALIRIGDSAVMLADEFTDWGSFGPKSLHGSPVTIHIYVEDVDAFFKRALAAGTKERKPRDGSVLRRSIGGQLKDPFGHLW